MTACVDGIGGDKGVFSGVGHVVCGAIRALAAYFEGVLVRNSFNDLLF